MNKFAQEYTRLNKEQRQAVDSTEGPVLVIAGPGTGKTQLLSMRVANLLRQPDITPGNVLCLTFTDNAARNMLERLEKLIGQPAYHVGIHTFHSFGVDIINQYPDFFTKRPLLQAIDQLGNYEVLRSIFQSLPHSDPLAAKAGDEFIFIKDTLSIISWLKQNAITDEELAAIIRSNQSFFTSANAVIGDVFASTPSPKQLPAYKKLYAALKALPAGSMPRIFPDYAGISSIALLAAIDDTDSAARFAPAITAWRNTWIEKKDSKTYIFKDSGQSLKKIKSVAQIYTAFQNNMAQNGLYDFDDMVMEAVQALESHEELRLNLQEKYQYILVDEFQDTNKAQLRILKALGNNPVNESKPNIMVVGDPNQAIYAFQGAQISNILSFMNDYKDVTVVNLAANYRSTQSILDTAMALLQNNPRDLEIPLYQRLNLQSMGKLPVDVLEHTVFPSELQQYQALAKNISEYLKANHKPSDIAIIAPKHKYLERLMPYLANQKIPVAYERRENILDAPITQQLLRMAELVNAIAAARYDESDGLWGEVLSYPFWNIPTEDLISVSLECYEQRTHWLPKMLKHKNRRLKSIAAWFVEVAKVSRTEPMEYVLDRLSGGQTGSSAKFTSPFREYYFNQQVMDKDPAVYLAHLGQLATLRQHLRKWKPQTALYIADLLEFVALHRQAKLKIIDTNPHTQSTNAVQVMTAHKAKGLEFDVVFIINAQDEIWGPSARSKSDRIRLPKNLPIKPAGETDEDKLRLLFVALTRARHSLYISSYTHNLDNKLSLGLSFIGGNSPNAPILHPSLAPRHVKSAEQTEAAQILSTDWVYRYQQIIADKPALFEPILANYKLNVTHLNNFLNVVNGGPQYFLLHNLLHFPEAMSPHAAYGDAIHKTLQWLYVELKSTGKLPLGKAAGKYFSDMLERKHLPAKDFKLFNKRGVEALADYLHQRRNSFSPSHIIERGFGHEGVRVGGAPLSGKIDKMVPLDARNVQVVDFKTGKPTPSWQGRDDYEKRKLHRYEQQLMFYKLLVEGSVTYGKKAKVSTGGIESIETDKDDNLLPILELDYDTQKLSRFKELIEAVWQHISSLDFPDTSHYSSDYVGLLAFENDLIERKL